MFAKTSDKVRPVVYCLIQNTDIDISCSTLNSFHYENLKNVMQKHGKAKKKIEKCNLLYNLMTSIWIQ